jgi:hypothetical protein
MHWQVTNRNCDANTGCSAVKVDFSTVGGDFLLSMAITRLKVVTFAQLEVFSWTFRQMQALQAN